MEILKGEGLRIVSGPLTTPSQLKQSRNKREERSDAVQNRLKILEVAQALFAEHGVENVTMTEIAEKACIGKGTLYRHFSYKGELCLALIQDNSTAFQNEVLAGFSEEGLRKTALGRLFLFIESYLDFIEQNYALLKPAFEASKDKDNSYQSSAYATTRLLVVVLLKEAAESGECRADLDVDYMADALQAPLEVNLFTYQRQALGFSVARIKAGMRQLIEGIVVKS